MILELHERDAKVLEQILSCLLYTSSICKLFSA